MHPLDSFTDVLTGRPVPADTVLALMQRKLGNVSITGHLRVVDMSLKPVQVLPETADNPDGSDIGTLAQPDATITHDSTTPVHRTLSFTMLDPTSVPDLDIPRFLFNPFRHLIAPSQVYSAGGVTIEVPKGYYLIAWPQSERRPGPTYFTFKGMDLTALISQAPLLSDYVVSQNYVGGYRQAAIDMITVDSIPVSLGGRGKVPSGNDDAGPAIPAGMIDVPQSNLNQSVPVDILYSAGANRLDTTNLLLAAIRHKPWTMADSGHVQSAPLPYFGSVEQPAFPDPDFDFSPLPDTSIIESPIGQDFASQGSGDFCNIYKVEGARPTSSANEATSSPFQSVQVNDNPDSLVSTVNLRNLQNGPRAVGRYLRNDAIANADMAKVLAQLGLQQGAQQVEMMTLATLHMALLEDLEVVVCQVTQNGQVTVPSDKESPWLVRGWTLPLKDPHARMTVTLMRAYAM